MARYLSSTQWLRWTLSYPMIALDTQLPNDCVGRQAFPMEAEGRLADFDRRIHPRQLARRFVSLITVLAIHVLPIFMAIHPQQGGDLPQSRCMNCRA